MLPEFRVLTKTAAIVTDSSSGVCRKVPPSPRRKREWMEKDGGLGFIR